MTRTFLLLLAATLLASSVGCRGMMPRWFAPGDIQTQRYGAVLHDPYPSVDAGPVVAGGRPRDFERPLAEPRATQFQQERLWRPYP